jgi:alkyl sulfatase BDS1-like metallo-beta-lactamase superfamily hydrolase
MYAHLNNQVLNLANRGVTINEMHNVYRVPRSQQQQWYARGYHGSFEHNSRAVINRYLGYWDGNPATLTPLSPRDSAPLYVEMMGGAKPIIARGTKLYNEGKYRLAQEILNKLIYAEPDNQQAKDLLADVWEQLGYQYESPSLRNSFLAAAYELRSGIPEGAVPTTAGPDMVRAMSTELFLDFLGVRVDSQKAEDMSFKINLVTPDNGEKYVVEMSNATLTNIKGFLAEDADLTITINRADLLPVMMGKTTLDDQIKAGKAKLEGKAEVLAQLKSAMVHFEVGFEILPGTRKQPARGPALNPFAQEPLGKTEGG